MGHAPEVLFFHTAEGWSYSVPSHEFASESPFDSFEEAQADYIAKGFADNYDTYNQPKSKPDQPKEAVNE